MLRLLTPAEFDRVPDGTLLISIDGGAAIKGQDDIDEDTRFGCMAWGFRDSQLGHVVDALGKDTI